MKRARHMFDPAMLLDIEKAVAPLAMVPPAIERAWVSPMAEQGERVVGAFLDAAEMDSVRWRERLATSMGALSSNRDVPRSDADLEVIDRMLRKITDQAREMHREAGRDLKRRARFRKRVSEVDPSAAKVLWTQTQRMHRLQLENAAAIELLAVAMRDYRNAVDTRAGAEPGSTDKRLKPNSITIAAMSAARAGNLEPVTLDDLRAALLEVD